MISDDAVFAWAIAKALLIVIATFSILVYTAWALTRQRKKDIAHVATPKDSVSR
jgi:hypothetical protein